MPPAQGKQKLLAAIAYLAAAAGLGLGVLLVGGVPALDNLGPLVRTALAAGASVGFLSAPFILFRVFKTAQLKAVESLTHVLEQLAAGRKTVSIPYTDRDDELGELARVIETTKGSLSKSGGLAISQMFSERRAQEAIRIASEEKHARMIERERAEREKDEIKRRKLTREVEERTRDLRVSEQRTRAIIDSVMDAFIIVDAGGRIESFNPAAETIFRYGVAELTGQPLDKLISRSERRSGSDFLAAAKAHVDGASGRLWRTTGRRKSGETFPMDLSITPMNVGGKTSFIGVARDVTSQVRQEAQMQRFGRLLDWSTQEILIYNADDFKIVDANRSALENLQYKLPEIKGIALLQLTQLMPAEEFLAYHDQLRSGEKQQICFETSFSRADGTMYPVEVRLHYRGSEHPPAFFAIAQDISERLEARNALLHAKETAESANRLKSAFLANMSHELRTPLNAVIGYSELLSELAKEDDNAAYIGDLEKINAAGVHLLSLIDDVLDLAKIESGKADIEEREFVLEELLREAAVIVQPEADRKGNELRIKCHETLDTVVSDPLRVRQVVLNVLSNANKFTEQGEIFVEASTRPGRDYPLLSIVISDTGIGIEAEKLEHLFDDFVQADSSTRRKYGGTGLGLAISRRICRAMEGDIVAESESGEGATFTITLPLKTGAELERDPTMHAPQVPSTAIPRIAPITRDTRPMPGKILIIEDSEAMSRLLEEYLRMSDYEVLSASTAREGLELLSSERPEIVILDMYLPDGSGQDILRKIEGDATLSEVKVIVCTSADASFHSEVGGVLPYITKPVNRRQVLETLEAVRHERSSERFH